MALARTLGFGIKKRGPRNTHAGMGRDPAPWLPNVPGMRYVRDQGCKGIVSKLVPR